MHRFDLAARELALVAALVTLLAVAPRSQAAGTLYGVFYDSTLEVMRLGTVDPSDASVALAPNSIPAKWLSFGGNLMAVDAALGVARVVAGPNDGPSSDRTVYTVNLQTGAEIDSNPLEDAVAPVPDLNTSPFFLEYDDATNTIYVVVQTVPSEGDRVWYVATLDPATGEVDPIGSGFPLYSAGSVSALDAARGRFHFIGRQSDVGAAKIYSVDVGTGAVTSSPDITSGVAMLSTSPDFLDFDPVTDRLLGLFGSTATDPRTRYVMAIDTATGAAAAIGDTFQERFAQADRGDIDPQTGTWYVTLRGDADADYRLHVLDTDAPSGTLVSNDLFDSGDPQVRNTPDFLRFAPEPAGAAVAALGALVLHAIGRRRTTASSPGAFPRGR
jgi:hypothetical protein